MKPPSKVRKVVPLEFELNSIAWKLVLRKQVYDETPNFFVFFIVSMFPSFLTVDNENADLYELLQKGITFIDIFHSNRFIHIC